MNLDGEDPQRVDCSEPDTVEPTEIVQNATEVDVCKYSDYGFVYDEREFVVCIDQD